MKICKQCGRELKDEEFRPLHYVPKSGEQRRRDICMKCENFNQRVNVAYRAKHRTPYQEKLVRDATIIYKQLIEQGLEPLGALANSLTGVQRRGGCGDVYGADDYAKELFGSADILKEENNDNEEM